jgi:hypothetical protein
MVIEGWIFKVSTQRMMKASEEGKPGGNFAGHGARDTIPFSNAPPDE